MVVVPPTVTGLDLIVPNLNLPPESGGRPLHHPNAVAPRSFAGPALRSHRRPRFQPRLRLHTHRQSEPHALARYATALRSLEAQRRSLRPEDPAAATRQSHRRPRPHPRQDDDANSQTFRLRLATDLVVIHVQHRTGHLYLLIAYLEETGEQQQDR